MSNNNYDNDISDNNINGISDKLTLEIMLTIMIFVSCCHPLIYLTKSIFEDCKLNYSIFKIPTLKIKSDNDLLLDECSICLDKYNINDIIVNLDCEHKFHKDCIKLWIKKNNNTCPQCRENII